MIEGSGANECAQKPSNSATVQPGIHNYCRWSLTYQGSIYKFFTLQQCEIHTLSIKSVLGIVNFNLFHGQRYTEQSFLVMLGSCNEPQHPVSDWITRVNNGYSAMYYVTRILGILCSNVHKMPTCVSGCFQLCMLMMSTYITIGFHFQYSIQ